MKTAIVNFNGGEFSPKIDPRADTEKYASGCRVLQNMIPLIFGGVEKRPGTEFIKSNSAFDTVLAAIVARENIVICRENTVVVTGFDTMLSQIICRENDVICVDNNIVSIGSMAFLKRAVCLDNTMIFLDNEVVYT